MAALNTGNIVIPTTVADEIWKKAYQGSALAQLSGARPQKFGTSKQMVLTGKPKAELVGEGAQKSPTPATFGNITVNPYKLQVTVRVTDEVKWADEDYMLGVWDTIEEAGGEALGRALDIVGIHKVNPLTGQVSQSVTSGLTDTTLSATVASGAYEAAFEEAYGKVVAKGYFPNGIAADPVLKLGFATEKDNEGRKLYPEVGLGVGPFTYNGLQGATSSTIGANDEISGGSGILGIVGQFDAFRWGVQREINAKLIEFGDPDGQGDLQRNNQVAIRLEIVYGIGICDKDAFAKILAPLA